MSYTKGCFLGQETLARLHYRGHVNRLLVGMTPEADTSADMQKLIAEFSRHPNNYDEIGLRGEAEAASRALDLRSMFPPGCELFRSDDPSGKPAGHLTSAAWSPQLAKPLILGTVRREVWESREGLRAENLPHLSLIDLPITDHPR